MGSPSDQDCNAQRLLESGPKEAPFPQILEPVPLSQRSHLIISVRTDKGLFVVALSL